MGVHSSGGQESAQLYKKKKNPLLMHVLFVALYNTNQAWTGL